MASFISNNRSGVKLRCSANNARETKYIGSYLFSLRYMLAVFGLPAGMNGPVFPEVQEGYVCTLSQLRVVAVNV